jgi:hypothetical protein
MHKDKRLDITTGIITLAVTIPPFVDATQRLALVEELNSPAKEAGLAS